MRQRKFCTGSRCARAVTASASTARCSKPSPPIVNTRPVQDRYHSAIEAPTGGDRYIIEMTPAWGNKTTDWGVVREGPVEARWLGRFIRFRYEIRRWRTGVIPDIADAVHSQQVSDDLAVHSCYCSSYPRGVHAGLDEPTSVQTCRRFPG